jgi:hypothetical protein
MAVFTISDATDLESTDLNLFFPVGIPEGHDLVRAGFTLEPKLMMVTPNSGSNGGTLVQATVPGIGTSTEDIDLVDETGRTICREDAKAVEYGLVQCWTRRDKMETEFAVKLKVGDQTHECANDDKAKCNYK